MSSNINYKSFDGMATNDFVRDLKSLSACQTKNQYSAIIERLTIQLKESIPNSLMENKPLSLAIVNNLYRVIPIFDNKLSNTDDNANKTNIFLEAVSKTFQNFSLFNLFCVIKDSHLLDIIFHNYIPLIKQSYFTTDNKYDHLLNCLLPMITSSSSLVTIIETNLPSNFLTYLLQFTRNNLQNQHRSKVIYNVLNLIKVFSILPALAPMVIRSEWPHACIQWLTTTGPRPSYNIDFAINLVLQKVARNAMGVEVLNRLNCATALIECDDHMKNDHNEEEYSSIHFIQCVTHALLTEAKEIKEKSITFDARLCSVLEKMISFIISTMKNDFIFYKGCHLSEILCVLCKLFLNDDILKKCINENDKLLDCLYQLLIKYATISSDSTRIYQMLSDETLLGLVNLLWSISFHECYHEKFTSNPNLMHTLSNLATSSSLYTSRHFKAVPRDVSPLKKAADGILWNLKCSHVTISKERLGQQSHVMISYSHNDSTFCHELVDGLAKHMPVWVDYKQKHLGTVHSDDLWEEIAGAMETATAILVIVSKDYYDSKSCRQELSYACDTLKKRIVPLYVPNQKYKASGWLGIRIAGQKYVHFGRKDFTSGVTELLSILTIDQKDQTVGKLCGKVVSIEMKEHENDLKRWTPNDIRRWFTDNQIHSDLITLFVDQFRTGTAMLVYARHLKHNYQREYLHISMNYQQRFDGKRLQTLDFVTFVDALWRLREEHDSESKREDIVEKCSENQLRQWSHTENEKLIFL